MQWRFPLSCLWVREIDLVAGGLTYQVRETLFRLWKIKLPHSGGASRDNHRAKNSRDLLLLSSGPLSFKTAQRIGLMLQEKKNSANIKKTARGDPELQKRMQPRHSFDCFLVRLWAKDPVYLYHNSAIKKKKLTDIYVHILKVFAQNKLSSFYDLSFWSILVKANARMWEVNMPIIH